MIKVLFKTPVGTGARRLFGLLLSVCLMACVSVSGTDQKQKEDARAKFKSKFRVTAVRTYAGFDDVKQSERVYSDSFDKEKTSYVWVELYVENLLYEKQAQQHAISWVWLNPDGSQRGRMDGNFNIKAEWKYAWNSRGWGWDETGKWPEGTYTALVLVDGVEVGRSLFRINNTRGYLSGTIPSYPGAGMVSEDACPKGSASCGVTIEIPDSKQKAFLYYKDKLVREKWIMDVTLSAGNEMNTLGQKGLWGIINCNRDELTLTVLFPSILVTVNKPNQIVFNLMDRGAQKDMAAFVGKIARYGGKIDHSAKEKSLQVPNQMNKTFKYEEWSVVVKKAVHAGKTITKTQYYNPNRPYRFSADSGDMQLIRVVVLAERNDGKPIEKTFLTQVAVKDDKGRIYQWIGAGTEDGEYFDRRKTGAQSLLVPVQPKDTVEYVFQVPFNANIQALIWKDHQPIGIVLE